MTTVFVPLRGSGLKANPTDTSDETEGEEFPSPCGEVV